MLLSPRRLALATCCLAALPAAVQADPLAPVKVTAQDLPAGIAARGQLESAWKLTDKRGTHYVLFSRKQSVKKDLGSKWSERSALLYVDAWLVPAHGKPTEPLPVRDLVEHCPLALTAAFHDDAFEVTDLDHDGDAEITFGYELGCRSDVSPDTYKVLTLEDGKLYALRGKTHLADGTGGDATPDPSFARAPAAFLEHARQVWARTDADSEMPPPAKR